jgi:hypothetical protein
LLERGLPFLRSDALPKIGWGFLSEQFFNGFGIKSSNINNE